MAAPFGVHINVKEGGEPPVYSDFNHANLVVHAAYFTDAQVTSMKLKGFREEYQIQDLEINKARSKIIPGIDGAVTMTPGSSRVLGFPLTEKEYNDAKPALFIWCEPLGAAAIRCSAVSKYKRGLLFITEMDTFKGSSSHYKQAYVLDIELFKSVVSFAVDKTQQFTNGSFAPIDEIKAMKNRQEATGRFGALSVADVAPWKAQAGDIMTGGGNYDYLYAKDNPEQQGVLDLKPQIGTRDSQYNKPTVPASKDYGDVVTIGNNGRLYSRDVFSNLNWGYVGDYAGFGADELNGLAKLDPFSTGVPQDDLSTIRGAQVNRDVQSKMRGENMNACLAPRPQAFRHIVRLLDTDDRFTRVWDIENGEKLRNFRRGRFVDSPGAVRNLSENEVGPLK